MILETFMPEYGVELYEKNGPSKLDYTLLVEANTIERAAIKAAQELEETGFIIGYKEVWTAKIKNPEDPKGEDYEILKDGVWLINPKTGKKLSNLEEKLD